MWGQKEIVVTRDPLGWLVFLVAAAHLDLLDQREDEDLLAQLDLKDPKASKENEECKEWLDQWDLQEKQAALVTLVHLGLQEKQEQLA